MKVLVSQAKPANMAPYEPLIRDCGACIDFRPFFRIEPLSAKEFRAQRINLPDYTAILFSSRSAIDAYFALAEEMRFKVPDTMKYFCTTELVAMYLQKHIVYRKRKIFYGDGRPDSVVSLIGPKHKGEKFLVAMSEGGNAVAITSLMEAAGLDCTVGVFVKSVAEDLHDLDIKGYDVAMLYNQHDVQSLLDNFPGFEQGSLKIVAFGKGVVRALDEAGLGIAAQGPTPECNSAAKTLENYLKTLA